MFQVLSRGYPSPGCAGTGPRFFPRSLVPDPFWGIPQSWPGGTPVLAGGGGISVLGYPQPGQDRGPLQPGQDGVPHPSLVRMGYPSQNWGTLHGQGPSPPSRQQQSEHLLCGGRYASCIHTEGLSGGSNA